MFCRRFIQVNHSGFIALRLGQKVNDSELFEIVSKEAVVWTFPWTQRKCDIVLAGVKTPYWRAGSEKQSLPVLTSETVSSPYRQIIYTMVV